LEAREVAAHLVVPQGDFEAEGDRLGVDAVRAADLRRVLEFEGAALESPGELPASLDEHGRGLFQNERLRGIDDIVRSEAVMQPARMLGDTGRGHLLGDGGGEGDDVVFGFALDRVDAIDIEARVFTQRKGGFCGDVADFGESLGGGELHFKPLREAVFVGENFAHLRACVAWDQKSGYKSDRGSVNDRLGGLPGIGDDEAGEQRAAVERLFGALLHDGGMIVVLADVAEDDGGSGGVEMFADETAGDFVRQVPHASHHALLYGPGIGTDFQHLQIVIRLEQQNVGSAQMESRRFGKVAEIGGDGNFDALGAERKSDGILRVVRDGKRGDVDIADGERCAGLELFELGRVFAPRNRGRGEARDVDGDVEFFGDRREAGDVIGVLVSDQDGVDRFGIDAGGGAAFEGLFAAQSGVDEEARR